MSGAGSERTTVDENLRSLLSENIIGEPIDIEDWIIIPVTKMVMAIGRDAAKTAKQAGKEGRARSIAGGGVGVFPVSVVILSKRVAGPDGVRVVSLFQP